MIDVEKRKEHWSGPSFYFTEESPPALSPLLDFTDGEENYRFTLLTGHISEHYESPRRRKVHRHSVYHIVFFVDAANRFSYSGRPAECRPGTLVLCPPGRSHSFAPLDAGGVSYHELTFAYRPVQKTVEKTGKSVGSFNMLLSRIACRPVRLPEIMLLPPDRAKDCARIMKRIIAPLAQERGDFFHLSRRIITLFAFLIDIAGEPAAAGGLKRTRFPVSGIPEEYRRASRYIRKNYRREISVNRLARRTGVSCEHFCRRFKQYYGFPPGRYQTELRMRAARAMLRTGGRQCGEIAQRLGFSDRYFFSKVFKKYCGVSPSQYRDGSG